MTVFSKTEQEAIILKVVWGMIDDMVNYEMFVKNEKTENTNLMLNTATHARLFNILLGDFLSPPQRRHKNALPFDLPEPPHMRGRPTSLTSFIYGRYVKTPSWAPTRTLSVSCWELFPIGLKPKRWSKKCGFPQSVRNGTFGYSGSPSSKSAATAQNTTSRGLRPMGRRSAKSSLITATRSMRGRAIRIL